MRLLTIGLAFFTILQVSAQVGTVRGTIYDNETNETLLGAVVYNGKRSQMKAADFDGTYALKLQAG